MAVLGGGGEDRLGCVQESFAAGFVEVLWGCL